MTKLRYSLAVVTDDGRVINVMDNVQDLDLSRPFPRIEVTTSIHNTILTEERRLAKEEQHPTPDDLPTAPKGKRRSGKAPKPEARE